MKTEKKLLVFILLICSNLLTYGQSPIIGFKEKISYVNCSIVMAEFDCVTSDCSGINKADYDSVSWDFGDGMVRRNSFSTDRNYSKPGTYTVTLTLWKNGKKTQFVKPDLIKVYQPPKAQFDYTVSNNDLTAPLQVEFTNQSVLGDGDLVEYSWKINSYETVSNNTNFSYTFEKSGTYYVQLIVSDNNGCKVEYSDYVIVKDPVQTNEFEYITSKCNEENSCPEGINYKIENNTLKLFGRVWRNCCSRNTAVIIDNGDTIKIPTFESGAMCTCICQFCFEINIPNFDRESCVVEFDDQIINVEGIFYTNTIVNENSSWAVRKAIVCPTCPIWTDYIYFDGDSIVGNYSYKKVFSCNDKEHKNVKFEGLMREQNQKTYFIAANSETEQILYDFSLEEGMNFEHDYGYTRITFDVSSVDAVEIGGSMKKRIQFMHKNMDIETWIEGIGSISGILNPFQKMLDGGTADLLCYFENEELVYKNPKYPDCYYSYAPRNPREFIDNIELIEITADSLVFKVVSTINGGATGFNMEQLENIEYIKNEEDNSIKINILYSQVFATDCYCDVETIIKIKKDVYTKAVVEVMLRTWKSGTPENPAFSDYRSIDDKEIDLSNITNTGNPPVLDNTALFPNPVQNVFYVNLEENKTGNLEMYDLQGGLMLTKNITSGEEIDVSFLPSGVYTVLIDKKYIGSIIKN